MEAADGGGRASVGLVEVRVGGGGVAPELLRFPQSEYRATIGEDAVAEAFVGSCEAVSSSAPGPQSYRIVAGDPQVFMDALALLHWQSNFD